MRREIALYILFGALFGAVLLGGCAGQKPMIRTRTVTVGASKPKRLDRSYFTKPHDRENLSEAVIQRVINAPLQPEFPARLGVLVLDSPFSRRTYTSLVPGDRAPQLLARRLERSRHFVMVSDISPYLVKSQDIEALRELATRYRLKYLVIFNRRFDDRSRLNSWGWSWLSLVGIPFAPAYTYQSTGLLEATLMDVRTGTFLFTVQVHTEATRTSTPWGEEEKLEELQQGAARNASTQLAKRFLQKCQRLVKYVKLEQKQLLRKQARKLPPPAAKEQTEAQKQPEQRTGG